jgi:hypothetical protein
MTREEYLKLRNDNQISLELAWEYYQETPHPTSKVPPQMFAQLFTIYCNQIMMMGKSLDKMFLHYDMKFNIHLLEGTYKGKQIFKYY